MAKNTSIGLSPHFNKFIGQQIDPGRYGSTSEVVRAGLRLLKDDQLKLSQLRMALDEGEASGLAQYDHHALRDELDHSTITK